MVVFAAVVDWLVADEVLSILFLGELGSTIVEVRKGGGGFDDFRVIWVFPNNIDSFFYCNPHKKINNFHVPYIERLIWDKHK